MVPKDVVTMVGRQAMTDEIDANWPPPSWMFASLGKIPPPAIAPAANMCVVVVVVGSWVTTWQRRGWEREDRHHRPPCFRNHGRDRLCGCHAAPSPPSALHPRPTLVSIRN